MRAYAYAVLVYGLFILFGGVIGFMKAHSWPSLIMGASFSLPLIGCAFGMLKNNLKAFNCAGVLAFMLMIFFSYRFFLTLKMMPAGMLALISLALLSFLFFKKMKKCSNG
jgi:uncharacterized membrane protein (UPF0136 family)